MKNADWKDTAELIGIAAIVASLVFVGLQMRQSRDIAIAETYLQEIAASYSRAELAATNAVPISKANRGEQLTDAEYFALSEYVNSRWLHSFYSLSHQRFLGRETGGPISSLTRLICTNPGLGQIWKTQSRSILEDAGPQLRQFVVDVNGAIQDQCGE